MSEPMGGKVLRFSLPASLGLRAGRLLTRAVLCCLLPGLSLLLSLTPCFSAADSVGSSAASTVSPASAKPGVRSDYTLDQVLAGIRSRDAKYRAVPLRIEYSCPANDTTYCTLVIHGNNFRNEVRDAKGRKRWEYRVNGVRAEVSPADSKGQGDAINYYAHDDGFHTERMVALLVDGIEPGRTTYLKAVEKAGNLQITKGEVNGIPCVELSRGPCFAPQYDWTIVQSYDMSVRGFRRFGERFFPTVLESVHHWHYFEGSFLTTRETCEIRSVSQAEVPGPDFWKIPEPQPGARVQVRYATWRTKWEDELGPPLTWPLVLDCVNSERVFAWPPAGKDVRIYETSRYWRDRAKLDLALNSETPLPFMSADGEQIVWASYEPARQRLSMLDPERKKESVEAQGMKFEAGFVPERNEIRLGEPLNVTFYVTNTGTQTFYLETGGDARGLRSDRFQFWAVELEGTPAPDPHPNLGHHGGSQGLPLKVAPGDGYCEKLNLSLWVKFERPAEYLVRGRRVIQLLSKQELSTNYALAHPLLADFKLTVRGRDMDGSAVESKPN